MARQQGAGIKAWGISNSLRSQGFTRSDRVASSTRTDPRMTAGFKAKSLSDTVVQLEYVLGNRHGIASAPERAQTVEGFLAEYTEALQEYFIVDRTGSGEHAYLLVRTRPDPAIGEALRKAATQLAKHKTVAETLNRWAEANDQGHEW